MKAVIVLCVLAVSGALASESCYNDVELDCSQFSNTLDLKRCNAKYGEYGAHGAVAGEMKAFANLYLKRSYDYLLTSAFYNNYENNRVGFSKLFRKMSDEAWDKTIDIIKHVTMRGDAHDFAQLSTQKSMEGKNYTAEIRELEAIAKALDTQKELAERAFFIHREATRNSQHLHDPEVAQYLEEEFIEDQAKKIRDLAGHTNDLKRFITLNNGQDLSLALYLFDEYLQKTVI